MRKQLEATKEARTWARQIFPGYNGRRFYVETRETLTLQGTYWSGGSRNSYGFVSLDGNGPSRRFVNHAPPQFGGPKTPPVVDVLPGMVYARLHEGSFEYLTFIVHPETMLFQDESLPELTEAELIVLVACHTLKAGPYRFEAMARHGVSRETFEVIRNDLRDRFGFFKKGRGGLTVAGSNAASQAVDSGLVKSYL